MGQDLIHIVRFACWQMTVRWSRFVLKKDQKCSTWSEPCSYCNEAYCFDFDVMIICVEALCPPQFQLFRSFPLLSRLPCALKWLEYVIRERHYLFVLSTTFGCSEVWHVLSQQEDQHQPIRCHLAHGTLCISNSHRRFLVPC